MSEHDLHLSGTIHLGPFSNDISLCIEVSNQCSVEFNGKSPESATCLGADQLVEQMRSEFSFNVPKWAPLFDDVTIRMPH